MHPKTYAEEDFWVEFRDCAPRAGEQAQWLVTAFQLPVLVHGSVPIPSSPTFLSAHTTAAVADQFSWVQVVQGCCGFSLSVFFFFNDLWPWLCGGVPRLQRAAGCLVAVL